MSDDVIQKYKSQIVLPQSDSHKGENGRVLVIGGSKLFHAAPFWAAVTASKIVDLVHFTSPAMENNDLMRVKAKGAFWDGIVIPWEDAEHYIEEDDAILIGPGMPRDDGLMEGEKPTADIVNMFLRAYPEKKWVVDGGALQAVEPAILTPRMIVTPNQRELSLLAGHFDVVIRHNKEGITKLALLLGGVTVLAKGVADIVSNGKDTVEIPGGSPGMTKGGTGDVLAGLVTGLYARSPAFAAAAAASRANKAAGESLAKQSGPFFSASDLAAEIPRTLRAFLTSSDVI